MPGRTGFHERNKTTIKYEPLDLTGPKCINASFREAYSWDAEEKKLPGAGLRPQNNENSLALVLECPDYMDFQPVEAPIFSPDPRWKYAFAAKTRVGYRCLWLSEVPLVGVGK